jgi:uncharacterized delta-60 repeat protein
MSGSDGDWVTARLNSNGTLDSQFNGTGLATLSFPGFLGKVNRATVQADGKIVLAGDANVGGISQFYGQGYNLALARYDPDGTLDASFHDSVFNSPGIYIFNGLPSEFEEIWGIDLQSDGKLTAVVGYNDTFDVARFDLGLLAASGSVNVTNTDGLKPTAANDAFATSENATLTVGAPGILTNDSDPDGDTLTAVLVSGPSHGSLTLNSNGSFTYQAAANFSGTDSFTCQASDGRLTGNIATVSLFCPNGATKIIRALVHGAAE